MYSKTRFGELMEGLPRSLFEKWVTHYESDKHSKGFKSWDQLLAMIYAQLSGCDSLRELEAGFNSQSFHHYHLGTRAMKRSTLSEANSKRDCRLFEQVLKYLLNQTHRQVRSELTDLLYLLDSSPINLKGLGYDDWTKADRTYRTQGLKLHMVIAPDRAMPVAMDITAPNLNDIEVGRQTHLESGATYVFDKGYYDYNWWHKVDASQSYFVTRFKHNASIKVVKNNEISASDDQILDDALVMFNHRRPGGKRVNHYYGKPLRRVVVHREDKATPLVLATNDMTRSAQEIAQLYKRRWAIELFFKWLKQNLKIKRFLGRSLNAVKTQIYIALITYLLLAICHQRKGFSKSLKLFAVELKASLFQRFNLEHKVAHERRRRQIEHERLQGVLFS